MAYTEQLNAINDTLSSVKIHNRDYIPVNQRVLAFWSLFPNGRIITKCLADTGERCDFICEIYREDEDEKPAAVAHTFEVKRGNINSTSYIENAETSAVGRALGFLGIGATDSIASAEEVESAVKQQEEAEQLAQQAKTRKKATKPTEVKSEARKALEAISVDYSGLKAVIEERCKTLYGENWEEYYNAEKAQAWEHLKGKSQKEVDEFVAGLAAVEYTIG